MKIMNKDMKKKLLIFIYGVFFVINLHADIIKVVPNFLIKADGGVGILMKEDDKHKSDVGFNALGRITFAIDPFVVTSDEKIKRFEFRITPQGKIDCSYNNHNEFEIGAGFHILCVEARGVYNVSANAFRFVLAAKPELNFYFSESFGLDLAPFWELGFSKSGVDNVFGLELGIVYNATRKHRNDLIRKRIKNEIEYERQLQSQRKKEENARIDRMNLARKIIAKKYNFTSENDYINWRDRCSSINLYRSLTTGWGTPFLVGDIISIKPHTLSIKHMDPYIAGSISYLVSVPSLTKCCNIVSLHQISYTDDYSGLITEPLILRYVGKGKYRYGYTVEECDSFAVIERDTPDYNEYINMMSDIASIEENPYLYKDILEK